MSPVEDLIVASLRPEASVSSDLIKLTVRPCRRVTYGTMHVYMFSSPHVHVSRHRSLSITGNSSHRAAYLARYSSLAMRVVRLLG